MRKQDECFENKPAKQIEQPTSGIQNLQRLVGRLNT